MKMLLKQDLKKFLTAAVMKMYLKKEQSDWFCKVCNKEMYPKEKNSSADSAMHKHHKTLKRWISNLLASHTIATFCY